MGQMKSTTRPQFLLQRQSSDIAVGANPRDGLVDGEKFTIDVWSPTGNWGGGTVNVYMVAAETGDDTAILLESFTEDTVRFGEKASLGRRFKADLVGATGADISCTLNN